MDDREHLLEIHIRTMEESYSMDEDVRNNDEVYLAGCRTLVAYVNTAFGSIEGFNTFMKAAIVEEANRRSGYYDVGKEWSEVPLMDNVVNQAEEIVDIYENVFKRTLEELENLPLKRGRFNPPLPSP